METVLFGLALAAGAAALTWWIATSRDRSRARDALEEAGARLHALERDSTVVLDLNPTDVDDERVQRLVREAAAQVFAQEHRVETVTVKNPSGRVLGRVPRHTPPMREVPELDAPRERSSGTHRPRVVHHDEPPPLPEIDPDDIPSEPVHRELAETFELPEAVESRVTDPDDVADLVWAILDAGGHDARRDGEVVRAGDVVFLMVGGHGRPVLGDALSRAFLRFTETRAPRGYAVVLGFADGGELRRREQLAPQLTYVGRSAVQRMADAVAVGADPLNFVQPPRVEVVRD